MTGGRKVARLTVSEVAKRLQISEEAVERLTVGEPAERLRTSGTPRSWDFAQASAIFAVFASAVYALGLLSFWIPLSSTYPSSEFSSNLIATWHMAGLVPRNVVLGQGMVQLLLPPIALWLLWEIWALVSVYILWLYRRSGEKKSEQIWVWVYLAGINVLFYLWAGVLYLLAPIDPSEVSGGQLKAAVIFFFFAIGVSLLVTLLRLVFPGQKTAQDTPFSRSQFFPRFASASNFGEALSIFAAVRYARGFAPVVRRAAGIIAMAFFLGLAIIVLVQEPPLPTVIVTKESSARGEQPVEQEGLLLAHTEGFWHILNNQGELLVLSDKGVKTAKIVRNRQRRKSSPAR
jgi:hypothetical protein